MSLSTTIKSIQDIMRKDAGVDGDAQRIGQLGWMLFFKIFSDLEIETELEDDDYESPVPPHLRWNAWANEDLVGTDAPTGDDLLDLVDNALFPALKDLDVAQFTGKARQRAELLRSVFEDAYNYMKSGTLLRQVINKINHDIDFNESTTRHLFGDIYEQILKDLQGAGNAGEFYTPAGRHPVRRRHGRPAPRRDRPRPGLRHRRLPHRRLRAHAHRRPTTADQARRAEGQHPRRREEGAPPPAVRHQPDGPRHRGAHRIRHGNTLARPLRDYGPKDQVDVIVTNPPFGGMEEDGIENNFPAEFRTRETADLFLVLVMELLKDGGRAAIVLPDGTLFGEGIKTRIKQRLLEECNLHTIVRLPKGVFAPYTTIKTNILFFTKGEPTKDVWFYEHPYPDGYKSYSKTKPMRIEEFEPEKAWWDEPRGDRAGVEGHRRRHRRRRLQPRHRQPQRGRRRPRGPRRPPRPLRGGDRRSRSRPRGAAVQPRRSPAPRLMDAKTLLDNFATIADAPGGVQRLRELVLDLAVRGRLVTQDPADQPASTLPPAVRAVRDDMARAGLVPRSPKIIAPVVRESWFDLPKSWCWVRLDEIAVYVQRGKSPRYSDTPTLMPVLSQKCVQWSGIDPSPARYVDYSTLPTYGSERFLQIDDLLWNSTGTGTVGRVALFSWPRSREQVVADSHVTVIRTAECSARYVLAWLSSVHIQSRISDLTSGTTQQQELNT